MTDERREILERALEKHSSLALRSEKHKHYLDLLVDIGQLNLLKNPDWQLIYGRRGAGKSLLLGAMKEEHEVELSELRIVSLLITAQDCVVSPPGSEVSDKTRASAYFEVFIDLIADQLTSSVDRLLGTPGFLDAITGNRQKVLADVSALAQTIRDLCREGSPIAALRRIQETVEHTDETQSHRGGFVNVGGHLSANPYASFGVGIEGKNRHTATEKTTAVAQVERVTRHSYIRRSIMDLLELLNISHLNLLIDEWPALDPTGRSCVQSEFAELMKRTFAGTDRVSVKIASNRYQTALSNKATSTGYRGLEIGADIFEATNLDRVLVSQGDLLPFYRRLIYKRLVHVEPELGDYYSADDRGDPGDEFVASIFASNQGFEELVRGAEGLPRNFIVNFNELAALHDFRVDTAWRIENVRNVLMETSVASSYDIDYQSPANDLLESLVRRSKSFTSRKFLVRHIDRTDLQAAIDELLEKRLIHELPRRELGPQLRAQYDGYLVDYGLWLDLAGYRQRVEVADSSSEPTLSVDSADQFVIRPPSTSVPVIICRHCKARFRQDDRPYRLRGLCPECYLLAGATEEESGREP